MDEPELDLDNPGTLTARSVGAERYRFVLASARANLTAPAFEADPAFAGAGVLLSADAQDRDGYAILDLTPLRDELRRKVEALGEESPSIATFVIGFPGAGLDGACAVAGPVLAVRRRAVIELTLDIDPDLPASLDDRITLSADDGSFSVTKTVRDDVVPGDTKTTLRFEVMDATKTYSIVVDPGAEGDPYWLASSINVA